MEANCTSLATSKRLKDAGFPQNSGFNWYRLHGEGDFGLEWIEIEGEDTEWYAAPTSTEIYLASNKDPRCNVAMPEDAARAWLAINEETTNEQRA